MWVPIGSYTVAISPAQLGIQIYPLIEKSTTGAPFWKKLLRPYANPLRNQPSSMWMKAKKLNDNMKTSVIGV
jgi:hypothetical protein